MESERIGPFLKVASGSRSDCGSARASDRADETLISTVAFIEHQTATVHHHRLYRLPANEILLQRLTDACVYARDSACAFQFISRTLFFRPGGLVTIRITRGDRRRALNSQ